MKKLGSMITMGCLVSSLLFSSNSYAFASEGVIQEAASYEKKSSISETETEVQAKDPKEKGDILEETDHSTDVLTSESNSIEVEAPEKEPEDTSDQNGQSEQIMRYSNGKLTRDPGSLESYLREDPAKAQKAITLTSETGAVIDGYHLNHDQVKVLNINTGNITINTDTYSQQNGETDMPWDAKSDAYVIRGKGNSENNITISSPQVKVTIYIMDLEWSGTITYGNSTEVELVICGAVLNHRNFLSSATNDNLTIRGLTAEGNSISVDKYFAYNSAFYNLVLENIEISANNTIEFGIEIGYAIYCNNLVVNHSKLTNMMFRRSASIADPSIVIQNSSQVNNMYFYEEAANFTNTIQVTDSIVDNIRNYYYYYSHGDHYQLLNIHKMIADNSLLTINTSSITNLEADKCTIEVLGNLSFKNLIANSCSIKGDFVGTPVDYESHDLFLKILRLREHPNEYVSVSIDGGEKVKFLTDLNGCVYPYIKAGSTSATVTTADGTNFSATFDPVTAHDKTVIVLTPGGSGSGGEGGEGGGTVDIGKPEITDTSLKDLYLNLGDAFSLSITAKSKTSPANLTYQWYKDGEPINLAKAKKRSYSITKAKAEHDGVYCCYVTDNNNNQVAVSKEVYVSVNVPAAPNTPVVMSQSSSMELVAGSSVTLSVNARPSDTRSSLLFQWYKGTEELEGKTSRTLALTNIKAGDAGSYYCLITDDLFKTTTKSAPTVISVK